MIYIIPVVFAYFIIAFFDIASFYKDKKQMAVYGIFMTGALILSASLAAGIEFTSVASIITKIFSK